MGEYQLLNSKLLSKDCEKRFPPEKDIFLKPQNHKMGSYIESTGKELNGEVAKHSKDGISTYSDFLRGKNGLVRFYGKHDGINWQIPLRHFALGIYDSSTKSNNRFSKCYQLLDFYIHQILLSNSPFIRYHKPENFTYFPQDFSYRDQILNLEALNHISQRLLEMDSLIDRNKIVLDTLVNSILSTSSIMNNLQESWQNILVLRKERLNNEILESKEGAKKKQQQKEINSIDQIIQKGVRFLGYDLEEDILKSWNSIITETIQLALLLHEVSRVNENSTKRSIEEIEDSNENWAQDYEVLPISGKRNNRDLNHAENNFKLLIETKNFEQKLSPRDAIIYSLLQWALKDENDLLSCINKYESVGLVRKGAFESNPIGFYVATLILLGELPTRICWQPDCDDRSFFPVVQSQMRIDSNQASLNYFFREDECSADHFTRSPKLLERREFILGSALGPNGLGILNSDQSENFQINFLNQLTQQSPQKVPIAPSLLSNSDSLVQHSEIDKEKNLPDASSDDPFSFIRSLNYVNLRHYRVVGNYVRFDEKARGLLTFVHDRIMKDLNSSPKKNSNYLLWSPSGMGKSFFPEEIAAEDKKGDFGFFIVNFAKDDQGKIKEKMETIEKFKKPVLCLIDEVGTNILNELPADTVFSYLNLKDIDHNIVSILVDSTESNIQSFCDKLRTSQKYNDLLNRVPVENRISIPLITTRDRIIISLQQTRSLSRKINKKIDKIEKLALYYIATKEGLDSARQIRDFLDDPIKLSNEYVTQLTFNALFPYGQANQYEFLEELPNKNRRELQGSYVSIEDE